MKPSLEMAMMIAAIYHAGQVDKSGAPYVLHLLDVASRLETVEEKTLGLLHDVLEDTEMTEERLRLVFPADIVDDLLLLTHKKNEPYMDYVGKMAGNERVLRVKEADLRSNIGRTRNLTDEALVARLRKKYGPALLFVLDELDKIEDAKGS